MAGGRRAGDRRRPRMAGLVAAALLGAVFLGLVWAERRRPLRRRVEPALPHATRNVAIAGLGAAVTALTEWAAGRPIARWAAARRIGLLHALPLPPALRIAAALVLLDYTLWIWHRLNHRLRFLWRFHLVHHVDRDLDASTGLRFHFGELGLSVGLRAGQVVLLGVDPRTLAGFQAVLLGSVLFHHSNLRLPLGLERAATHLVVTPRMHGIHHSIVEQETDSNFSSLLSCWDRLHRTLRLNVPQAEVTIGVPAYREPAELALPVLVALPFRSQRPAWRFPTGGRPERFEPRNPRARLAE
jgi:sterol desaturase/sphingolipid hydroxylase (fatty acid hydroxylase superfamily)